MKNVTTNFKKQNVFLSKIQERMKKSDCYLFNDIDFLCIPTFAEEKLAKIFLDFEKQYKKSKPTIKSLLHAAHIVLEKEYRDLDRVVYRACFVDCFYYKKLMSEAIKEYEDAGYPILFESEYNNVVVSADLLKIILVEHLIRYPFKITFSKKLTKLRTEVRKYLNCRRGASVGF